MKVLGIIGGIGSGKSTAAEIFQQFGTVVINADNIGHQILLMPDVKKTVQVRWGQAVFRDDGEIDRRKLATVVFADEKELEYLKSLTHPLIADEINRQRKEYEQSGVQLCLLDAPLLLEANWDRYVDQIVFVSAPAEMRCRRVKCRGWSENEWQQREASQFPVEEKQRLSDIILDNSGDLDHLQTQVKAIVHGFCLPSREE